MTAVVSVRGMTIDQLAGVVYVGRPMPRDWRPAIRAGHPLGNPFRPRPDDPPGACLRRYQEWLASLPLRDELLGELCDDLCGRPLGCWCGAWRPGEPDLACHAVILARMLDALWPPP